MITAIGDLMRVCYERGWITTRDGNCSLRRKNSSFVYITPSGWRKNLVYPELMIRMTMQPDKTLKIPDGTKPSGELHMHYLLLKEAATTRAVIHLHPTHVIAAMYRGFDLQHVATQFPEIFRYTHVGPTVPPIPATTRELGEATAKALGVNGSEVKFDIVGQANHGVCAVAADPWSAFEHVERLDHICEILLTSGVTPEEVKDRKIMMTPPRMS
jgi:L-fuculose-phosphate aldolase